MLSPGGVRETTKADFPCLSLKDPPAALPHIGRKGHFPEESMLDVYAG